MADKTIPELTEATSFTGTAVFPFDTGVQSFRISGTNLTKQILALFAPVVQTKTVDYDVLITDSIVRGSGNRTFTMPDAALCTGKEFTLKKTDAVGTAIGIAFQIGQSADGETTLSLTEQYSFYRLKSNGVTYDIVGSM